VLFDTWVHPLMMGLEEHLITMFREDMEFHDEAAPSHLGPAARRGGAEARAETVADDATAADTDEELTWDMDAERELRKIPFFVRGKARRNTERYARERGTATITIETLYDAKAHFGR
jgi:light-independent protochlorophyllide reductase subunit B